MYDYLITIRRRLDPDEVDNPGLTNRFIAVDEFNTSRKLWKLNEFELREIVERRLRDLEDSDIPQDYELEDVEDEVHLRLDYTEDIYEGEARTTPKNPVDKKQRHRASR